MQKFRTQYYRNYYLKKSVKDILIYNADDFNEAASVIAFHSFKHKPELPFPDYVEVFADHLKISPKENSFEEIKELIKWEEIDTVLIYKKTHDAEIEELLLAGKQNILISLSELKKNKKYMDADWEFISKMRPDMFLSKKINSVMIGSLSNRSLIDIRWNMPDNNNRAELINDNNES